MLTSICDEVNTCQRNVYSDARNGDQLGFQQNWALDGQPTQT